MLNYVIISIIWLIITHFLYIILCKVKHEYYLLCTYKCIEILDDLQLTKVLSRLLHLETDKYKISKSSTNCSVKIIVADGGEHASIKWDHHPITADWFKCMNNLFQFNTPEMELAKYKEDLLYRDTDENNNINLKSMVEKVFDNRIDLLYKNGLLKI